MAPPRAPPSPPGRGVPATIRLTALGALALLGACASLPTAQTAGFKTLASGSEAGFAALSGTQSDALATEQLALVAQGKKTVSPGPGCYAADSVADDPCVLVVGDRAAANPTPDIALGVQTPRMQKLLGSIGLYAKSMDDLAVAKDLDKAAEATGKAAASLKSLASTVYPGGGATAGAVIDALAFGANQLRIRHRRALLLRIATAADPVVAGAATVLGREAVQLRGSLLDVRKRKLRQAFDALDAYDEKPDAHAGKATAARTKLLADISADAAAVTQARAIRTDFTPLAHSHALMLAALRDPHADLTSGVVEAQAFQDALKTLTDLEPAPPAHKPAAGEGKSNPDDNSDGES
jgi:hypothetical protein